MAKTRKSRGNNSVGGILKKVTKVAEKIIGQTLKVGKRVFNDTKKSLESIVKKATGGGKRRGGKRRGTKKSRK